MKSRKQLGQILRNNNTKYLFKLKPLTYSFNYSSNIIVRQVASISLVKHEVYVWLLYSVPLLSHGEDSSERLLPLYCTFLNTVIPAPSYLYLLIVLQSYFPGEETLLLSKENVTSYLISSHFSVPTYQ